MNAQELSKQSTELRQKILQFESALKQMPQIEIPIFHHFAPGIYMREMRMKAGLTITGKIHKTEHKCMLMQGTVVVVTEEGRKRYTAPAIIHSMPGTKRALHALSDVVWVNVHHNPDNLKSEEEIEKNYVVDTYDQFLSFMETKQIEGGK